MFFNILGLHQATRVCKQLGFRPGCCVALACFEPRTRPYATSDRRWWGTQECFWLLKSSEPSQVLRMQDANFSVSQLHRSISSSDTSQEAQLTVVPDKPSFACTWASSKEGTTSTLLPWPNYKSRQKPGSLSWSQGQLRQNVTGYSSYQPWHKKWTRSKGWYMEIIVAMFVCVQSKTCKYKRFKSLRIFSCRSAMDTVSKVERFGEMSNPQLGCM